MKKTLLFTALITLISTSALAKVYECVDSRGNHSYSEVPNGKNCRTPSNLGVNFSTSSSYKPALTDNIESASNKADTAASNAKFNQAAIATARQNLAEAQKALEEGKKYVWVMSAIMLVIWNASKGWRTQLKPGNRSWIMP